MKIEKVKNLEMENIGGMESGIKAGISQESMSFLFELMSKSLYSNPIGSTVREIVSNGFDAHIAAGVDEPVIVKKTYDTDDNCYYLHVIDKGTGMSPKVLVHIYMNYFSSTKRDTNDQIGGFGLGSKTPLSYQDLFYITTVHEGKKYELIMSRGESEPEMDSLHGFSEEYEEALDGDLIILKYPNGIDTDESNGTEIKIEVKNADIALFEKELKSQLCYFDNVYFYGWNIDNNYKIFEGEHFKYRNKNQYYENEMHIVYGKVSYPISWRDLKMTEVNIPVAVKFEIGELVVTPNRESLRYTDEVKALVKERINLCIKELVSRFKEQNPQIDNIFEFMNKRNERPHIRFDEYTKLYIPKIHGVENSIIYTPLPDINMPVDVFFEYQVEGRIENGQIRYYNNSIRNILESSNKIYFTKNKIFSLYKNIFLGGGFVISKRELSFADYCRILGLYYYEKYERYGGGQYDFTDKNKRKVPILGKAILIKKYKKHIEDLILSKSRVYQDIEVDENWIKEYKLSIKMESDAYRRKMEKKVMVKINRTRKEVKIEDLAKAKIVFYEIMEEGSKGPSSTFCMAENMLHVRPGFKALLYGETQYQARNGQYYRNTVKDRIYIIEIAKTNFKYIKDLDNVHHIDEFLKPKNRLKRLFRDFATSFLIREKSHYIRDVDHISKYYQKKVDEVYAFLNKHDLKSIRHYEDKIMAVAREYNLFDQRILMLLNEIDKFHEDMEILDYIHNYTPTKILAEIFRYKKKLKLNSNLYSIRHIRNMPIEKTSIEEITVNLNQEQNGQTN